MKRPKILYLALGYVSALSACVPAAQVQPEAAPSTEDTVAEAPDSSAEVPDSPAEVLSELSPGLRASLQLLDTRKIAGSPRPRAVLVSEIAGLKRLLAKAPPASSDHMLLLRRMAEDHAELRFAATRDAESAPAEERARLKTIAAAASEHATSAYDQLLKEHEEYSRSAEAMFFGALEYLYRDDLRNARALLFRIVKEAPTSSYVPLAYFTFGELFRLEGETDSSKRELAVQAYGEAAKAYAGNTVQCLASLRRADVEADPPMRVQYAVNALRCVRQPPKDQLELGAIRGKAIATLEALEAASVVKPGGTRELLAKIDSPNAPQPVAMAEPSVTPAAQPAPAALKVANERRTALVIGNSSYRSGPLANPANDARLIAATLSSVAFNVTIKVDASQAEMKRAIDEFGRAIDLGGVGLFYYAGHGMQVNGENYLIPVDANVQHESDIDIESVSLSRVLARMDSAGNRLNVVILDACRDNPFARKFRSGSRGLALADAPEGSFIAYATGPGAVASDGTGKNSPFSWAIARNLKQKGWRVEQVFKAVRREVKQATNNKQTPWESSSLENDFYFVP